MAVPRSKYVHPGEEGVHHCLSRCVRQAFLYGVDQITGQDFSHRKEWVVGRLRFLATIFAVDVCAYAVMHNLYHTILRTRPDLVESWPDREVARRWLCLCPPRKDETGKPYPPEPEEIEALAVRSSRILQLRERLCSLSWFMGQMNEHLARAANHEESREGRFWESRFKSKVLLDEAAIATCMVYVDLSPVRAGEAKTPEESDFASIRERIRSYRSGISNPDSHNQEPPLPAVKMEETLEHCDENSNLPVQPTKPVVHREPSQHPDWLCPVQSNNGHRGILSLTTEQYLLMVDLSGRIFQPGHGTIIPAGLEPRLVRIGINPERWSKTIKQFGADFHAAAGQPSSLRRFATRTGQRWIRGLAMAAKVFSYFQSDMAPSYSPSG